ncbi:hypothetical protein DIS24_g6651 [Lasiodiplodia hormozganensis]|uniref:Six-bladed beta-propeller-like protein n=1 Tax=Lasiodiplodia hormozganensis TaxID=869390 RepID=A0AA39YDE0_9PEZI|nr:hypothetical protein DIS24_g6651 [Lasiodiplodia hormozganensis]
MVTFTSLFRLLPLLSLSTTAVSQPILNDAVFNAASTHTVYQYPLGTWVENIAVRHNGNLLVTFTQPTPSLHEINPSHPPNTTADPAATLVHTFTNHTQLTGITELAPDVFAVIADNSVYRVDLTTTNGTTAAVPIITLIANLPTAGLLNGMATLPAASTTTTTTSSTPSLLISDSELGLIWRLDPRTGAHAVFFQHNATMSPTTDLGLLLGINGLRYVPPSSSSSSDDNGYAYYVNSPRRLFCRVAVDPTTAQPVGDDAEVVARGHLADDFAVRREAGGSIVGYLAGLNDNVITRVEESGRSAVVAGGLNSTTVAGASSAAFGRTEGVWKDTLFVTTGGASAAPVNGTFVEGGKVVAVRLGY